MKNNEFFENVKNGVIAFCKRAGVFFAAFGKRLGEFFVFVWRKLIALSIFEKIAHFFKKIPHLSIWGKIAKMPWKNIGKRLLYPHTAVMLVLVPIAALFLTYMLINGDGGPFSIASYILSFYALVLVCVRIPDIVVFVKRVKSENKYLERYFSDPELRARISLYLSLIVNIAYAVFQVGLGLVHTSIWYYSLGGYYIMLSLMRFFLVRHDRKDENLRFLGRQFVCRFVGVCLLVMTLVLSGVILHMIRLNIVIVHHEITTIAMAAYTFTALTLAIVEIARRRKTRSLVFMVSKAISLVSALVSIITLENAMIYAFGADDSGELSRIMVAITGAAVCAIVVAIAIYIIVIANKRLQNTQISQEKEKISAEAELETIEKYGE